MKTTLPPFLVVAACTAALCVLRGQIASASAFRTVALSGQSAPGTASGVNYDSFSEPVLNAAGQTAFLAELTGSGVSPINRGIWSEGSGALALAAREGSQAPGTANGVNFGSFPFSLVLNAEGRIAFYAELTGSGVTTVNDQGIWSEGSGTLALLARSGSQAPGTASGVKYRTFISSPVMNAGGQTAFRATLTTDAGGIWSEGSGSLALAARSGSQAPGTPNGVKYSGFSEQPVLNASGQTAFGATLTGGGVNGTNNQGIWSEGSGAPALVARSGSQAPGTASGVQYNGFAFPPVLNAVGQTAFRATLTGSGVNFTNDEGIWSEGSGMLALVANAASQAPGTANGVYYDSFSDPVLNAAGQTVFHATLTGSGVNFMNDEGIWSEGSGTLDLVARLGSQAPGTASGGFYSYFGAPALNAAGQTAFYAGLTGSGVNSTSDEGIWATDVNGLLQLIVRKGEQLEIAPGDVRTVRTLSFAAGTGNEDGRPSGFNDLGQIAFWAQFVDGSEGIFVTLPPTSELDGDFDTDGDTDGGDFLLWQRGESPQPGSSAELTAWKANFGAASVAAHPIPEPASVAVLSIGLISLSAVRHRAMQISLAPRRP